VTLPQRVDSVIKKDKVHQSKSLYLKNQGNALAQNKPKVNTYLGLSEVTELAEVATPIEGPRHSNTVAFEGGSDFEDSEEFDSEIMLNELKGHVLF
jgi:hypothetical protein